MPDPSPSPRSVHVVGAPGSIRASVVRALEAEATVTHDSVGPLIDRISDHGDTVGRAGGEGAAHDEPPALALLLAGSVSAGDALRLLRAAMAVPAPWIVGLVEESDGGARGGNDVASFQVRILSLGWAQPLDEVAEYAAGERGPPLELRDVVRRVARARHDINNPLTSALAQTQLLILEHGDGEGDEELREVETQIKRIAALVAGTVWIRPRDG